MTPTIAKTVNHNCKLPSAPAAPPRFITTSFIVSPNTAVVVQGADQQFTAQALDQFHNPMTGAAPSVTWTTTAGSINSAGLFTASGAGYAVVTVHSGWVSM